MFEAVRTGVTLLAAALGTFDVLLWVSGMHMVRGFYVSLAIVNVVAVAATVAVWIM